VPYLAIKTVVVFTDLQKPVLSHLFCFRLTYYTEGNTQTFKAKGDFKVGTSIFKTEVWKDVNSGAAYAKGTASSVLFHELMNFMGFSPSSVPDFITNGLR